MPQGSLYAWYQSNGERIIVGRLQACSITKLSINTFERRSNGILAIGAIGILDHIENAGGEDRWVATSFTHINNSNEEWYIRPVDDGTEFLWRTPAGEPIFTCDDSINEGMRQFILTKLKEFTERKQPAR